MVDKKTARRPRAKLAARAVPDQNSAHGLGHGVVREAEQSETGSEISGSGPGVSFPVVAIGASAGGLASFTALLKALPAKSGMAFVLIQHLEPKHESALTILLSKATKMAVAEVSDGMAVQPDRVYVIPPNRNMTVEGGTLRLAPRTAASGLQRPIDEFCIALAAEQGNRAVGVVLSGTGSDGTYGLKAIKAAGGVTFAQDPKTAQWTAMPMSAITAGSVDFVLSPKRIAIELARIGRHPYLADAREVPEGSDLDRICLILRAAVGVDFRLYKQATVRRRISRRMALHKIGSLHKYALFLRHHADEPQALADDIFIHVTRFFRDPEAFQTLQKKVLTKLRERRPGDKRPLDETLRIWVAGCSTGEEVYSIAMLLLEQLGDQANRAKIQIFGTDIQERALELARTGIYSESAVGSVSKVRLKRFFTHSDHGYQINKSIRDLCVFARHDLTRDPPFSRLDLVSCRNVLIYMGQALQKRILSMFQYALRPGGFLFLGTSESVSDYSDAFTAVDQKSRIFVRKVSATAFREINVMPEPAQEPYPAPVRAATSPPSGIDFRREAEGVLLQDYTPPALVVDEHLHIVHFQGDTSPFLAPATGQPSFHLLKMVRPEFVVELRSAIAKARKSGVGAGTESIPVNLQGRPCNVRLEVRSLPKRNSRKPELLIVFRRTEPAAAEEASQSGRGGHAAKQAAHKSVRLERELTSAREHLRSLIAEHETAQEEMKAANEEILSSNEELQSTNEELETAKEELQSSNEELVTLNDELQHRNAELNVLTHDLGNLLVGVDIPVLVLDADLRVRRFTPMAGELLNLIAGDVGRPFSNIASTLEVTDWKEMFTTVTDRGQPLEREVCNRSGHRYSMRVRPYKTGDGKIDGVLIVFLDTDVIAQARDDARKAGEYAHAIVETIHEALAVVDSEINLENVNRSFCDLFRVTPREMEGKSFFGDGPGQCNSSQLQNLLKVVFSKGLEIAAFELDQDFPRIGRRRLVMNARRIASTETVLIAIEDATFRKQAREELERSESALRALLDSASQAVLTVREDGQIVMVNGNTEKMFGYTRPELIGQLVDLLIPDERRKSGERYKGYFANMVARIMGAGATVNALRKDGTTFPAEISLSSIEADGVKMIVAFVSDVTQRTQMEKSAQAHSEQVQALAARLLTVQEEERRRVSRELHDQICQQLASMAIEISGLVAAPPSLDQSPQVLKKLQKRVIQVSEATRHLAYELHPSVLDDLGLVASLRVLCKQVTERDGLAVQFHHGELPPVVSREVASCLYRVAQESLHNVALHSDAKKVTVSIGVKKDDYVLSIVDDGAGFDPAAAKGSGGLGLVGMEERARLVEGKITIAAKPGQGTRIALRVPLFPGAATNGKINQGKTNQGTTSPGKARPSKARPSKMSRSKTSQSKTRQSKASPSKARPSKASPSKANQDKTV
jgi:two-component system CheB/CheR fusion protein